MHTYFLYKNRLLYLVKAGALHPIGNYTEKFNKKTKQTYYAGPGNID